MPLLLELDRDWFDRHGQEMADRYGEDVLLVDKFMDSVQCERDCLPGLVLRSMATRHELALATRPDAVIYRPKAADSTGGEPPGNMSSVA